jgi:hypothetical protein
MGLGLFRVSGLTGEVCKSLGDGICSSRNRDAHSSFDVHDPLSCSVETPKPVAQNTKHQTPESPNFKHQHAKAVQELVFGDWDSSGVWILVSGDFIPVFGVSFASQRLHRIDFGRAQGR